MKNTDFLNGKCLKYQLVGSRVTCDPAPTDTDQDVLVLTDLTMWRAHLEPLLVDGGFEKGGSDCGDSAGYMSGCPLSFQSFTLGELNLIVTFDAEFYRRFLAATGVCKHLNLMPKSDRVMLFQAVLYGNSPVIEVPRGVPLVPPAASVQPYWVEFEKSGSKCVDACTEQHAMRLGEELSGLTAVTAVRLPYPAEPRLTKHVYESFGGHCPSFCYSPHSCKGRSSCPQSYSCTE